MNTPARRYNMYRESIRINKSNTLQRSLIKALFDTSNHSFINLNWYRYLMAQMNYDPTECLPSVFHWSLFAVHHLSNLYQNGFMNDDEEICISKFNDALLLSLSRHRLYLFVIWFIHKIKKESK